MSDEPMDSPRTPVYNALEEAIRSAERAINALHEAEVAAAPLDESRLSEAISEAMNHVPWPGEHITFGGLTFSAAAKAIAAEYLRLQSTDPSPGEPSESAPFPHPDEE